MVDIGTKAEYLLTETNWLTLATGVLQADIPSSEVSTRGRILR